MFDFLIWSRHISRDHNVKAQEDLEMNFWGKMHLVLGIVARKIAS